MERSSAMRAGLAERARVVLLAADGVGTAEIGGGSGISKPTVIAWKQRYAAEGIGGLETGRSRVGRGRSTRWRSCWPPWSRRRRSWG